MKKLLLSFVAFIMCSVCFADEAVFDFGSEGGVAALGIAMPAPNSGTSLTDQTITSGGVKMSITTASGKTDSRLWLSTSGSMDFRIYTGSTFTLTAPEGKAILSVVMTGATINGFTVDCGSFDAGVWAGEQNAVTFTATATEKISTITVTYAGSTGITAPSFSIPTGIYYQAQDVEVTAPAGDVYVAYDEGAFEKCANGAHFSVEKTTTLYAYAEVNGVKSNIVSATYTIAKKYASLDELLKETPTKTGWPVIVPIQNEEIFDFYWSKAGENQYKNGVYLVREANGKHFELYKQGVPDAWQIGDKLTGLAKGIYQDYNGQWEISLLNWDEITNGTIVAVQAPVISFDEATATVTITDPSGENNTIYYTLNGAEPDDASILYEGPFVIETAVQVRAVCYNDDDQKSAITTETCIPANAPYTTVAELIAGCTATSQNDAPTVTFTFEGVSVNGINGSNVFIQDATGSFLLYGKNANFNRGDVISGTVSGKLYSYNGLPELSVTDWNGVTATPTGAIVAPTVMNAADITAANASQFVYLQNMNFVSASTGGKHISYLFNQNGTDVTLFDQFDVLQNVVFNTEDKYNARVFVIPYKENIQYYAVATEDLEVISDKQDPETRFINIAYLQVLADGSFKIPADHYETLSDGAKTFTSSNEDVATVDNEGNVTLKSIGVAIITLTTASTAKYSEGKSTTAVSVVSHVNLAGEDEEVYISTGREIADPWEANDVNPIYVFGEGDKTGEPIFDVPQWIHGYIVGYADGALTKAAFNTEAGDKVVASNILLSANKNTTDVNECIPVALATSPAESKAVRAALNLKDNPDNLGKEVWIYGDIMKYFSVAGVKNVTDYSLDGVTPVSISDVRSAQTADSRIYNLQGQLLAAPQKGAINIIGGKKVYVK